MLFQYFEKKALSNLDKPAVRFENEELTYLELLDEIDVYASSLKSIGVTKNDRVIISCEKNMKLIPIILSITKLGATYVPVDPDYPKDRRDYIFKDSKAKLIISEREIDTTLPYIRVQDLKKTDVGNTEVETPEVAYIIYTSGTTGYPKGVEIPPSNLISLFESTKSIFNLSKNDIWTMFHSYSFDFSVWEMWGALLSGSTLILVPKKTAHSLELFVNLLEEERVTVLNQTPAAFYQLMNCNSKVDLSELRLIIFGGDKLNLSKLLNWKMKYPHQRMINMYGITETTVHVTFHEINIQEMHLDSSLSIIGKAIPGWNITLRDQEGNIVPKGDKGEIWVSGLGVAKGYLNRKELTSKKFVSIDGERWYKSGDLAIEMNDGDLAYLGRIDNQVKVRGYRIELEEIKNKIEGLPGVNHAGLIVDFDDNGNSLIVFLDLNGSLVSGIKSELEKILPHYYIPSRFIELDNMPLTINGKIDQKQLKLFLEKEKKSRKKVPTTYLEVWENTLGYKLTDKSEFFENGGDSLKAMSLIHNLKQFYGIEVSLVDLFTHPSPGEFEKMVKKTSELKGKNVNWKK